MNPFGRRTRKETLYLLLDLLVGTVGFSLVVTGLATGVGLLITLLGIPVLAATLLLSRAGGHMELMRARVLLGVDLPPPNALRQPSSLLARLFAPFQDAASWKAATYFVLMLPVGIVTFTVAVTWWSTALGLLTLPAWAWTLPGDGPQLFDNRHWSEPWELALSSAVGLLLTLAAPFVIRGVTYLDRAVLHLLRRPPSEQRIETLEESRARSVDAAVDERRRIERDLHDGAQQRLVALGLDLGLALENSRTSPRPRESSSAGRTRRRRPRSPSCGISSAASHPRCSRTAASTRRCRHSRHVQRPQLPSPSTSRRGPRPRSRRMPTSSSPRR
jgi:hypothetical protein